MNKTDKQKSNRRNTAHKCIKRCPPLNYWGNARKAKMPRPGSFPDLPCPSGQRPQLSASGHPGTLTYPLAVSDVLLIQLPQQLVKTEHIKANDWLPSSCSARSYLGSGGRVAGVFGRHGMRKGVLESKGRGDRVPDATGRVRQSAINLQVNTHSAG